MKKTAFSLVELAVVILVIATITAGIIKGSSMIRDSRLSSARSLTANSQINEIDGIIAWYETTLENSLLNNEEIDNYPMSTWNDISSQRSLSEGLNILMRSADNKVVYRKDGINNLPSLQFAASGRFSLSKIEAGLSSSYSLFAVLSPTLNLSGVDMVFIDSYLSGNNNSIGLTSNALKISSGSAVNLSSSFSQSQEYIIGAYLSSDKTSAYVNNVTQSDSSTILVNGFDGLTIGADRSGANNFTGLISEIIIFNRILSQKERISIMSYLSRKYDIRVQGAF